MLKTFTKPEFLGLSIIFLLLIVISVPNFIASLRRARDQSRRDSLLTIENGLNDYFGDFGVFPLSSGGSIVACKRPEDKVTIDSRGQLIVDLIPCKWGTDKVSDLTPGGSRVYLDPIPADPDSGRGREYAYFSDGQRYQIFAAFEMTDEAGYDARIVARNLKCGDKICNVGRGYGCAVQKTLEQCEAEAAGSNKQISK